MSGLFIALIPYGDEHKENMWSIDIFGKLTDQDVCTDDLNMRYWEAYSLGYQIERLWFVVSAHLHGSSSYPTTITHRGLECLKPFTSYVGTIHDS